MYDLYNNILRYSGNYLSITTYYFFCQKYSHKIMFVTQVYWVHQSCNEFQKHGKVLKTNIRAITFWISLLPFTISKATVFQKAPCNNTFSYHFCFKRNCFIKWKMPTFFKQFAITRLYLCNDGWYIYSSSTILTRVCLTAY